MMMLLITPAESLLVVLSYFRFSTKSKIYTEQCIMEYCNRPNSD
jgi:hypothetical protein